MRTGNEIDGCGHNLLGFGTEDTPFAPADLSGPWDCGSSPLAPLTPPSPDSAGHQLHDAGSISPQRSVDTLQPILSTPIVASDPPKPPVPNIPPTAADWDSYRTIFTQLYAVQGKTLRETMQVMQYLYKFQATEKMFKTRVASWGLHKYQKRYSSMRSSSGSAVFLSSTTNTSLLNNPRAPLPTLSHTPRLAR